MPNCSNSTIGLASLAAVGVALLATACADTSATLNAPALQPVAEAPLAKAKSRAAAARAAGEAASPKAQAQLAEARAQRSSGDKAAAARTLDRAAAEHPADVALMMESGLLALDLGEVAKAERLLRRALDPRAPNWRVHLGLGTALAALGKQQQAQLHFAKALELAPDHPSIVNNLALSYALDGRPAEAEKLLRRVAATSSRPIEAGQAKQNLALLLGMSGRIEEAQRLSAATLPPDQARANVEYLKSAAAEQPATGPGGQTPAVAATRGLSEPTYRLGGANQ